MKQCKRCLLTDAYPGLSFDDSGTCSMCASDHVFEPYGEAKLIEILEKTKSKRHGEYDALVPLSGGKDSTYILYLAVKKYNLKVLTMTYDNGFVSKIAEENMRRAVELTGVKHIVCKPDTALLRKIYKNALLLSGDICGVCGIAIRATICKIAEDYDIPMILLGTSPLENNSYLPDTTQDIGRFKRIMREAGNVTTKELNNFLIYPDMNYFKLSVGKRLGKYAKEICPLFYIKNPSDKEMGEFIKREMGWREDTTHEYSKHFDCIVEPFTNYVRHHIYGYERRVCQYSTMIRRGELTREKALEMYESDKVADKPANYEQVLELLGITDDDMKRVLKIKPLKYEKYVSLSDKIFIKMMKFLNK